MATINWKSKEKIEQEANEKAAENVRSRRDTLLEKSDYTQLQDAPTGNRSEWAQYRKELRDITKQTGFPNDVSWPTPPEE